MASSLAWKIVARVNIYFFTVSCFVRCIRTTIFSELLFVFQLNETWWPLCSMNFIVAKIEHWVLAYKNILANV